MNKLVGNKKELEKKTEKDYSEYRLKRLLEILLDADLKRLEELCQKEKNLRMSPTPGHKQSLTHSV
ncbi:MAG: hypothetical protein WC578_01785 [Candidatus Omnitrophota bacterium]